MSSESPIYDFQIKDIDGESFSLEQYKGKVILIVNVASKCGYTPQYEGLQNIYEKYADEGLVIIGFPANNFGSQEPGSNENIKQFCTLNYGVTFPMAAKVSVKGDDQNELFQYLTKTENEDFTGDIKWNFEKFLIDREGNLVRRFRSSVKPESRKMRKALESLL
jgi:glutathione peroxidase